VLTRWQKRGSIGEILGQKRPSTIQNDKGLELHWAAVRLKARLDEAGKCASASTTDPLALAARPYVSKAHAKLTSVAQSLRDKSRHLQARIAAARSALVSLGGFIAIGEPSSRSCGCSRLPKSRRGSQFIGLRYHDAHSVRTIRK